MVDSQFIFSAFNSSDFYRISSVAWLGFSLTLKCSLLKNHNMKTVRHLLLIVLFFTSVSGFAQTEQIDSIKFFQDESVIDVTLEMDMKDLLGKKQKERFLPATISMDSGMGKYN